MQNYVVLNKNLNRLKTPENLNFLKAGLLDQN